MYEPRLAELRRTFALLVRKKRNLSFYLLFSTLFLSPSLTHTFSLSLSLSLSFLTFNYFCFLTFFFLSLSPLNRLVKYQKKKKKIYIYMLQ